MRPALKPGLRPVWRNRDTVQFGVDSRRAIALTGMRGGAALLGLLDGSRDHAQVLAAADDLGISPAAADRVIALLTSGGVLHDFPVGTYRTLPHHLRSRLAPELATAALAHGDGDGGARTLARRLGACVRVEGMSRAGLCVASLLTASGIGLVVTTGKAPGTSGGPEPPGSVLPAGAGDVQVPLPRAPDESPAPVRLPRGERRRRPDLVVLADTYCRELPDSLVRDRIPHLAASASEAIGVIGPLVLPGQTACLRCLDLARAERDPAWPLILAQLRSSAIDPPACDAVLAAAVAAQVAGQALSFIDRAAPASAVHNGTLELVLPDWRWRRRTWQQHHRCSCGRRSTS